MGLFRRKPRPHPLEPPSLRHIPLPDVKLLKKRSDEIADFKESVISIARAESDQLGDPAVKVVKTLLGPLTNELGEEHVPQDDESLGEYVSAAAVGLAHSIEEERRGWQEPGKVDARVHTAIHFQTSGGPAQKFLLEAGYWYGRTGDEGLDALVA